MRKFIFSDTVQRVLSAHGWSPKRRLPIDGWISAMLDYGIYPVHELAADALQQFIGIQIIPPLLESNTYYPTQFRFQSNLTRWHVEITHKARDIVQSSLYPIGTHGDDFERTLLLSETGHFYSAWEDWITLEGESFESGVENLILCQHNRFVTNWNIPSVNG